MLVRTPYGKDLQATGNTLWTNREFALVVQDCRGTFKSEGEYRPFMTDHVDGYDTIGECWGWGTHVHGWSCTPTRDMIFYTLGVTPAEPGYTRARIAPRRGFRSIRRSLRRAPSCAPSYMRIPWRSSSAVALAAAALSP